MDRDRFGRGVWLAGAVVSTALLAAAFGAVVVFPSVPLRENLYILGLLPFPVVGGLVFARQPDNRVGRLLVALGAWFAVGTAAQTYLWVSLEEGKLLGEDLAAWLATWTYWPAAVFFWVVVAMFPSGGISSLWLRVTLWVGSSVMLVLTVVLMIIPAPVNDVLFDDAVTNPWGIDQLAWLGFIDIVPGALATILLAIVTADLVMRWRRSRGEERLQMRWVGFGLMLVVGFGAAGLTADAVGITSEAFIMALWTGFGAFPAAIGVAVLRYRLYDIDRLISRTITYALVTGILVAAFLGINVLLQAVLSPLTADSNLGVAAATLAVAALFNPLRKRAQAVVDRRFNRARYDAHWEVDRFADRLRHELTISELTTAVTAVVATTVQPATASVWIRDVPRARPSRREGLR